jgi:acyl-CoA thioesterase YciA
MQYISTKICKTSDIGINDNLFGGAMLAWMDEAGGSLAATLCRTPNMITLKMSEVLFKLPVKVKEHIRFYGKPAAVGNSSVTLDIEARKVDLDRNHEETVCSTRIIFVRVDGNGKATPVDPQATAYIKKLIV